MWAVFKLPYFMTVTFHSTGFLDQEKDAAPVWWLENSSYPIEVSTDTLICTGIKLPFTRN